MKFSIFRFLGANFLLLGVLCSSASAQQLCNRIAEDHLMKCFSQCIPPPPNQPVDPVVAQAFELCRASCLSDERDEAKECCRGEDADEADCKVAACKREIFDRYGWLVIKFCAFTPDPISQATCFKRFTDMYMYLADVTCRGGKEDPNLPIKQ